MVQERVEPEILVSSNAYSNVQLNYFRLHVVTKLLRWLYQEEERLRDIYEREWKQLKALDESGGESWQIDSTQASIRNLVTKLNIVIRSANHISSRIHKIRDEELRPQLTELIQGYVISTSLHLCNEDCVSTKLVPFNFLSFFALIICLVT